jgi:hypothetical protein
MAYFRSHVLVSVDPICIEKGALIDGRLQDELVKQGLVDEVEVLKPRIGDPETLGQI